MFARAVPILQELGAEEVLIAIDSDYRHKPAVAAAMLGAITLFAESFKVVVEHWPEEWGKGIDDILVAEHKPKRLTGQEVEDLCRQIKILAGKSERPIVEITVDEKTVNDAAVAALALDPAVFKRGGALVHIVPADGNEKTIWRPKGSPTIAALPVAVLREHLADAIDWRKRAHGDKLMPAHPPKWAIQAIHARGYWDSIRPIEGIVSGPVLRADGTILATKGYDPATGLLCTAAVNVPEIADKPTRRDIRKAIETLTDSVVDFPFEKESHRAVWFSFLLTILARFAFSGPAPLFLVDANTAGAGKGLLCDLAAIIATGRKIPRMDNPHDNAEARKCITSLAISGDMLILIDNICGGFGGSALEAAMTGTEWRDRILGRSEIVTLPLMATWCGTGNNIILQGDMPRRVAHIRLLTPLERPEEREGFRHPGLISWAEAQRGQLLAAALTLLRGYCAAGRPDQHLTPWGSFEGWSELIRATLVWAGLPDPGATRLELIRGCDMESQALSALLSGILAFDPERVGLTVTEISRRLSDDPTSKTESAERLREALTQLCPATSGAYLNPRSVGMKLHHLTKRVIGGRYLDKKDRNGTAAWFVAQADSSIETPQSTLLSQQPSGTTWTKGTISNPSRTKILTESSQAVINSIDGAATSPSSPSSPSPKTHSADKKVF
jgi:hypothetical protein